MAPKQDEPVVESDGDDSLEGMDDLVWVQKKVLEDVSAKLEKKEDISKELVGQLITSDDPADDAVMVPVDLSDSNEIEDEENLIDKLGPAKVAEIFVKGRKKFTDSFASMPEEAKSSIPQEMTGAEYKKMVEEQDDLECGESELGEDDEEEEDGDDDDDDDGKAEEPAKKKAKTD
eukprot:CAMPEP_0204590152 /NCGR_PEP_ID=MMETSP0661-20131031/49628_1 /ASSEMBLY_ACC=CAM_ASM_000606 /TAXON_ID=109239 /ORGANISM="Alexandrium margalefi, Strain AMGDE01CS-322" /LENGTH=174 /DNA_ID=CAMNT_0051600161 /DNA_START=42 /DNA_END=566 /DNA_ORIENTATION=-